MKRIFQILSALVVGSSTLIWGIQYAYLQRGYMAIGGEYLFAVLAAILAYWLIEKLA